MSGLMRAAVVAAAGIFLLAASSPPELYVASLDDAPTVLTASTDQSRFSFTLDGSGRIAQSEAVPQAGDFGTPAPAIINNGRTPGSLRALVDATVTSDLSNDERCLATAVYYEAKGEPLTGQLAVAQVILNRVKSGRFAQSICGVVYQPRQFSFANGARSVAPQNAQWQVAAAIAKVAIARNWQEVAPAALYFHADYVAPGWGKGRRIAQVGNHIFYR
jgi:hypothetical protein